MGPNCHNPLVCHSAPRFAGQHAPRSVLSGVCQIADQADSADPVDSVDSVDSVDPVDQIDQG
jgi:hypothetical protein